MDFSYVFLYKFTKNLKYLKMRLILAHFGIVLAHCGIVLALRRFYLHAYKEFLRFCFIYVVSLVLKNKSLRNMVIVL